MTSLDYQRSLILFGYVMARLGDLQFDRAVFVLLVGAALIVLFHVIIDPWAWAKGRLR